ncbi:MAG TPA: DUF4384 domain-containing protein [Gemmatimonadales bacterium]
MPRGILIALLLPSGAAALPADPGTPVRRDATAPYVELWTNRDDVYRRGDRVSVYVRTDDDAYVTVFRIDTDGRVRVLFPTDPWDDNFARGGVRYQIEGRHGGYSFRVEDYPGTGYLFAVASRDPFRFSPFVRGDHWDYRMIGEYGRITGDPYVAFGDLLDEIIPPNYVDYAYDVAPYDVDRHYEYPRFLCYDCHTYAEWPYWNPYANPCISFRIVVYDDPYYYPARRYAGTRVVYRRPTTIVPRYVFKDRTPGDRYVETVRERPVDANGRPRVEPGATRRTVISAGERIPTPTRRGVAPSGDASTRVLRPRTGPAPRPLRLERRDPKRPPPATERRRDTTRTDPGRLDARPPERPPVQPTSARRVPTRRPIDPPRRDSTPPRRPSEI